MVLVLVALVVVFWGWVLASLVTLNLLVPEGSWRPLAWVTREPLIEKHEVLSSSGKTLQVDVYQPAGKRVETAMVIYTPLIGGGVEDKRLVNLAETFARAGLLVAVPGREGDPLLISSADTEDIVTTVEWLGNNKEVRSFGLFGISYGSGPTMAAAVDERIEAEVDFVVSLNGYYDLKNVIDFANSGEADLHEYVLEVVQANAEAVGVGPKALTASKEFKSLREELSPMSHLGELTGSLFIIHSKADRFIPYTESLQLNEARSGGKTDLVLTDVIDHGNYKPMTWNNLWKFYRPAVVDFTRMVKEMLGEHR